MKCFDNFFIIIIIFKSDVPEVCLLPPLNGGPLIYCRARHEKWYYNAKKGSCGIFEYGGCGGNDNRFDTQEQCEQLCQPK